MYFVIGLGNPGSKYDGTRHNVGFEVVDRFAHENNIEVKTKKHRALIGQGSVSGEKVIVVKPQTYMNLSGESVADLLAFYKEESSSIIVVYDDTDTSIGMLRIRDKGTAGGHNGIKSIISHLGTNEFARIKVGVGEKPPGWDLANYVLSRFQKDELEVIVDSVARASKAIERIISDGTYVAMNDFNGFA